MKKNLPLFGKIITAGILLAFLAIGCRNGLSELADTSDSGGNVTITVSAGDTARTLRPLDINEASVFSRIELEFRKGEALQTRTLDHGTLTANLNLEHGTWNISAKGFLAIGANEYEAAYGEASVEVGPTKKNVSISLHTGIFEGKPGVFAYVIGYPANVTTAFLEVSPLNDLNGYETTLTEKTVNLITDGKVGAFELLPGYYLLTLTARTGDTVALWNDLVHIYSGQETSAGHSFTAENFSTAITLSGVVKTGELNGSKVTAATVHAYGDANYVNRIASVEIPAFTKAGAYNQGNWSMTLPGSLAGGTVYFTIEQTVATTIDEVTTTKTFTRKHNSSGDIIPPGGKTDFDLAGEFAWVQWVYTDEGLTDSALTHSVAADGTVTITTTATTPGEWDAWMMETTFRFPAEVDYKYVYEFEAWTQTGTRDLTVQWIHKYPWNNVTENKSITINTTHQTFIILSDTAFDTRTNPQLMFLWGSDTATGTFYVKLNKIQSTWDYIPPPPPGADSRFTAVAEANGIRLTVNFTDLPEIFQGVQFINETTGVGFQAYWGDPFDDDNNRKYADTYELLYPYVDSGKEYSFQMDWQGGDTSMAGLREKVTAIGGRGELNYTHAENLALITEGTTLKLNKDPGVPAFILNAENLKYIYQIMTGTSWEDDPTTKWIIGLDYDIMPTEIDLLNPQNLPDWKPLGEYLAQVAGKTCFANFSYQFDYNNIDIYSAAEQPKGVFFMKQISTTPFIYPHVVPDTFTATQHPEGVLLTVDLTKVPEGTTSVQFHLSDWTGARVYQGFDSEEYEDWGDQWYDEWEDQWHPTIKYRPIRKWRGEDNIEIIYPFVTAGTTYNFEVEYNGVGTIGEATVTANAGLGDLVISNSADLGLYYHSASKTMRLTGTPQLSTIASSEHIDADHTGWYWQIYKGHNWDDQGDMEPYPRIWSGESPSKTPLLAVTFDNTFNLELGRYLSNSTVFINNLYEIVYRDIGFEVQVSEVSPWFTFPNFDPVVQGGGKTAFETNEYLWINCNFDDYSKQLNVNVGGYDEDNSTVSLAWYIDGVLEDGETYPQLYKNITDPGMHYGLVIITIDGAPFAQEFSFRVQE